MVARVMQRAVAAKPDDGGLWRALAEQLSQSGDARGAAAAFAESVARAPDDVALRLLQAGNLIRIDAFAEALEAARAAGRLAPDLPMPKLFEFDLLVRMGRLEEAARHADAVAAIDPTNALLPRVWGHGLASAAELQTFLWRCDTILAHEPHNTAATHYKAMTLARLGRNDEARRVMDYRPLLHVGELEAPAGYASLAAFCSEAADELRRNPAFILDRPGMVTDGVSVSLSLEQPEDRAVPLALSQIRKAVEGYVARLSEAGSAFAAPIPELARLHAWGVQHTPQGRLATHFHDNGWLSGVFYVTAQKSAGDGRFCGSLLLGAVDDRIAPDGAPPWDVMAIEPVPGRIVLFPSYLPHATEPPVIQGDRICISFDVVPVRNVQDRKASAP